jgi:hypothetical protein
MFYLNILYVNSCGGVYIKVKTIFVIVNVVILKKGRRRKLSCMLLL